MSQNTPLHCAAEAGAADAVLFLIRECGADATGVSSPQAGDPLISAARGGHIAVVDALIGARGLSFRDTEVRSLNLTSPICTA